MYESTEVGNGGEQHRSSGGRPDTVAIMATNERKMVRQCKLVHIAYTL